MDLKGQIRQENEDGVMARWFRFALSCWLDGAWG